MSASATAISFYEVEAPSLRSMKQLLADLLFLDWPESDCNTVTRYGKQLGFYIRVTRVITDLVMPF